MEEALPYSSNCRECCKRKAHTASVSKNNSGNILKAQAGELFHPEGTSIKFSRVNGPTGLKNDPS
jgi:hypothetical protein